MSVMISLNKIKDVIMSQPTNVFEIVKGHYEMKIIFDRSGTNVIEG